MLIKAISDCSLAITNVEVTSNGEYLYLVYDLITNSHENIL